MWAIKRLANCILLLSMMVFFSGCSKNSDLHSQTINDLCGQGNYKADMFDILLNTNSAVGHSTLFFIHNRSKSSLWLNKWRALPGKPQILLLV